jgi:hypothetical protein
VLQIIGYVLISPFILLLGYYFIITTYDIFRYALVDSHARVVASLMLFLVGLVFVLSSKAATFDYSNGLTVEAKDFRTAAMHCYKKLNPVFVTEEKALEAIDVCVNPVRIRK